MKHLFQLSVLVLAFSSCQQISTKTDHTEREKNKVYPYLERYIERNFPMEEFPIDVFLDAKEEIRVNHMSQTKSVQAFDQEWTTQGPGNIGARINTVAADPFNENNMLVGFSEGGIYKTTNNGSSWYPVFDDQTTLSIGDIVYDPNNQNVVYVGTGDPNISGYPFIGNGIYKSTDGGESWASIGLTEQRVISKIEVHPADPNTIYVASMGLPFTRNDTRGLYKTTDAGATWDKILYVSDSTGITDVVINPDNPMIIIASTWDRVRNNEITLVSGEGSGFYRSENGGQDWVELTDDFPDDPYSRTGLDICKNVPNNVFAMVVNENTELEALYRSEDYGKNFDKINIAGIYDISWGDPLGGFGWYFGKIWVNPNDPDNIFLPGVDMFVTFDGGDSWQEATPPWWTYAVHADKHDMIFKENGDIILATDGGLYKSNVSDITEWEDIENIATTQFYRVAYNPHNPEWYYGGAQDNGTTGGNIDNILDWPRIYGGDGFQMLFSPIDPDHYFVETQNGNINYTTDGGYEYFNATDGLEGDANWDMQYIISATNPIKMFTGTDRVYACDNSYQPEWYPISDVITGDGTVVASGANMTTIDQSPIDGSIYVGTNDGLVHRGNENGNFNLISQDLPMRYITSVKSSPTFAGHAYVTLSGYKDNDNTPRIHKTEDFGQTWKSIASNLPNIAINDVILIPDQNDQILFIATDGGIFGSSDGGEVWERVGNNMPIITCYDLVYNESKKEIVAATFGKSIMSYNIETILDDVATFNPAVAEWDINLFPIPSTTEIQISLEGNLNEEIKAAGIYNLNGQLVKEISVDENIERVIDVSAFEMGSYMLRIQTEQHQVNKQFIKI